MIDWHHVLGYVGVANAATWAPVFSDTITEATFSSGSVELVDFLATVLHESDMLRRLKENGSYSEKRIVQLGLQSPEGSRWRSLVPLAPHLAYNPDAFFEACYGGRMGNDEPGDGAKYFGRGLIGVTGKANYAWLGDHAGQDLVGLPMLLEGPYFALDLSVQWWEGKVPDSIIGDERKIRRVVNGGYFGLSEVDILITRLRNVLP